MKKSALIFTGVVTALSLAACSPTDTSSQAGNAGAEGQTVEASITETEGEIVEKLPDANADPMAQISVFTIKKDKTGLKQNMDAVDSADWETIDINLLIDKMIEYGILEEGTTALSFSQDGAVINVDLSAMPSQDDLLEQMAVANTLIQNYEAKTLNLTVKGESVGDGSFEFERSYKDITKKESGKEETAETKTETSEDQQ